MSDKPTILAVDDVPGNLKLLGEILGGTYRYLCTTSPVAALEIAQNQQPDLILLDVVMPELDGYGVCTRLKSDASTRNIPVIFVTSLKEETDEARGLEVGAIDYVTKPYRPAIVQARVRNHLELKRYRDVLERMTITDGLTGIPNRRHFDQTLDREWRSASRRQGRVALILVDVDFFKPYNDHYGHLQGDDCLRQVGQALHSTPRRASELVARYGGEEFACIVPDASAETAAILAEKLRQSVLALQLPHERSTVAPHVTISMGVASTIPGVHQNPGTLIEHADAQLYLAKKNRRNQIVSATL